MSDADDLDRYADLVAGMPRERLALLRAGWPEARKVFSDEGLVRYLRAIRNLEAAGVTWSTVVTFLREAPRLAREVGEQAVAEMLEAAFKVYARTQQKSMDALFATAPIAATRLREPRRVRTFFALVTDLAERAPRGVGPMLQHTDALLEHLAIEDLRNWALLGVQSHSADPLDQESYFDLRTTESRAFLRSDRTGVMFTDVRKRLDFYLRAL